MNLHLLHTITGVIAILIFFVKVTIHYYLDYSRDTSIGFGTLMLMPFRFFLPYKLNVDKKYVPLKHFSNLLLSLAAMALIANIIVGVLIYRCPECP